MWRGPSCVFCSLKACFRRFGVPSTGRCACQTPTGSRLFSGDQPHPVLSLVIKGRIEQLWKMLLM